MDYKLTLTALMEYRWLLSNKTISDSAAKLKEFPELDETLAKHDVCHWKYPICRFFVEATREEIRAFLDKINSGVPFVEAFSLKPIPVKPAWTGIDFDNVEIKTLLEYTKSCSDTEFTALLDSFVDLDRKMLSDLPPLIPNASLGRARAGDGLERKISVSECRRAWDTVRTFLSQRAEKSSRRIELFIETLELKEQLEISTLLRSNPC